MNGISEFNNFMEEGYSETVNNDKASYLLNPGFLIGLLLEPEDGGEIFYRKFG
jgi:hypothetical protein